MKTTTPKIALAFVATLIVLSTASVAQAQPDTRMASPSSRMQSQDGYNANDRGFVFMASGAGMYEVAISKMALEKGSSEGVKAFAKMMVDDHSKANDELKQLATGKGLPLADQIPASKQAVIDRLSGLSGSAFDRAYHDQVGIHDHLEDIALFQGEARKGMDRDLKDWAAKTLPTLKMHLQHARAMNSMR